MKKKGKKSVSLCVLAVSERVQTHTRTSALIQLVTMSTLAWIALVEHWPVNEKVLHMHENLRAKANNLLAAADHKPKRKAGDSEESEESEEKLLTEAAELLFKASDVCKASESTASVRVLLRDTEKVCG
eukprot:m.253287 g.253287  ORF g.253287 m.253287 type:complete len:129 (+) comp22668_c3_seq26:1129-1515(+)